MQSLDFAIMNGSVVDDARRVDRVCLRNLLGMTDEEITEFELKIAKLHGSQQSKERNAAALLKKYYSRMMDAYNKLTATKLEWWILADTSSQLCDLGQIMIALIGLSNLCNKCPIHISP